MLGLVGNVLPRDEVLPRAWWIARALISKPTLTVRYARHVLPPNSSA
jgi:hypothetical protein